MNDSPIRPPYPPTGSAEWWELRKRLEQGIARDSRKRGSRYTDAEFKRSESARLTGLDDADAKLAYERNGFTREQWIKKWNPEGKCGAGYIPTSFGR